MAKSVQKDDPEQSMAFIEKARERCGRKAFGCDKLMERLAKTTPEPRQKKDKGGR